MQNSNNDQLPIPKFTIFTATRSFGNGSNRVKASVLVIETAEKDAQYLKTLLNYGYENNFLTHGIFVPTGIHLTTSPEIYKGLLRKQNEFVKLLLVLPIKGISEDAMLQDINIEGTITTVREYIMSHEGIKGLERTSQTEETGKWFLLYPFKS